MTIFISGALEVVKQPISIFYTSFDLHSFLEFVIWLAPEHQLRHHDLMPIFISGALVPLKQHISKIYTSFDLQSFLEFVIWLAPEHQL